MLNLKLFLNFCSFSDFKIDCRNNYHSHHIIDEMVEIISKVIEELFTHQMRVSQAISLEQ